MGRVALPVREAMSFDCTPCNSPKPVNAGLTNARCKIFFKMQEKLLHLSRCLDMFLNSIGRCAREMDSIMNTKQHISNCFQRLMSVVLPGGTWHLGKLYVEWCKAETVAVRAMKHQAKPCRDFNRGNRQA